MGDSIQFYGTVATDKGYTSQIADTLTGLDSYHARYYDPLVGVFLSPDVQQGNAQGMDPYTYVGNNPVTNTNPSGQRIVGEDGHTTATITNNPSGGGQTVTILSGSSKPPQVIKPTSQEGSNDCGTGTKWNGKQCVGYQGGCKGATPQATTVPVTAQHTPTVDCGGGTKAGAKNCNSPCVGQDCCQGTKWNGSACVPYQSDPKKTRKDRLNDLYIRSQWLILGGALIFLLADLFLAINKVFQSPLDGLITLLDTLATLANTIIPDVAGLVGGNTAAQLLQGAAWLAKTLSGVETVIVLLHSSYAWVSAGAEISAFALVSSVGGSAEFFLQGAIFLARPAIGFLVDAGAHAIQAAGFQDFANYTQQMNMPIQEWCRQYGGCSD